jgi:ubiquinone/menaquinone biosynthesis C-methylase UbiE
MAELGNTYQGGARPMAINPAHEWLQRTYDRTARDYRAQDEEHICGRDYEQIAKTLKDICASFDREIRVLDLGCGTGRYFHCVQNARELVGLDISQQMLNTARNPVLAEVITARKITLIQGELFSANFRDAEFDLIYCLGVFGNGCGITKAACAQIRRWLAPHGAWFFDAIDTSVWPLRVRLRKNIAARIYSTLPKAAQSAWVRRKGWPPFFGNDINRVRARLLKANLVTEWITSRRSYLPQGLGYKLEALCRRPADAE